MLRLLTTATFCFCAGTAQASVITLQNATADFSQASFTVDETIDGVVGPGNLFNGWAVDPLEGSSHTAVWETTADVSASTLIFNLIQNFSIQPQHLIGRFRLSTTTDDRSLFADGLTSGGDITATWSVLNNPTVAAVAGLTFATLGDNSVLVNGTGPSEATYTVSYSGLALSGVTGLRLEVLADASLPSSGPGLQGNGNFVLTEFEASTAAGVPEPASLALLAFGLVGAGAARRLKAGC